MILYNEIWVLVRYHRWERFCITPKEPIVVSIVQEFYASFREKGSKRPYGYIWEDIIVRGEEVHVTLREICEFYNVSYYEAGEVDIHRPMDISQHETLYKQLEGWGFLPSPNDSAMQKGWEFRWKQTRLKTIKKVEDARPDIFEKEEDIKSSGKDYGKKSLIYKIDDKMDTGNGPSGTRGSEKDNRSEKEDNEEGEDTKRDSQKEEDDDYEAPLEATYRARGKLPWRGQSPHFDD
ncbi:hypothetical protein Gorai_016763 [Gossypium raimondii]|uniref:Uncharacterized protein n=1 Tax=Gossypium raimondii TaxID=29730 RepID=A0A7J8P9X9_GOSRA|nr:hypothetical protein [Gossypium raimondii]